MHAILVRKEILNWKFYSDLVYFSTQELKKGRLRRLIFLSKHVSVPAELEFRSFGLSVFLVDLAKSSINDYPKHMKTIIGLNGGRWTLSWTLSWTHGTNECLIEVDLERQNWKSEKKTWKSENIVYSYIFTLCEYRVKFSDKNIFPFKRSTLSKNRNIYVLPAIFKSV